MNENMNLRGRGKVSDFLNRLLHELIGFVQAIFLTVLSQISLKIISFYYGVKIGKINCFENVFKIVFMRHSF